MASIIDIGSLIIMPVVSGIGVLPSAFIVAVNLVDWAKGRNLSTCDRFLVALGISSTFFQSITVGENLVSKLWHEVYQVYYVYPVLMQLQIWTAFSSFWLTACLCVFYCVKIVDFNHRLFIWLKLRISKVVASLILGSVMGSLNLSIPTYWNVHNDCCLNQTDNVTSLPTDVQVSASYSLVVYILGFFVPLALSAASIIPILTSLYRHTRKMKENESGFSQPRLDAHFGASKMVGCLLVIYSLLFFTEFVRLFSPSSLLHPNSWAMITCSVSAQSITLIHGNTKLKRMFWKVFLLWKK